MKESKRDIREAAHLWRARLDDGLVGCAEREAFEAWMDSDPRHAVAFAEAGVVWDALGDMPAEALTATLEEPAHEYGLIARFYDWLDGIYARPAYSISAMAAVVFAVFIVGATVSSFLPDQVPASIVTEAETYATPPGQLDDFYLADGSHVTLSAQSHIEVIISESNRSVRLLKGAAFFDVAHDTSRPFVIKSGAAEVRVTGTAFDTQLKGDALYVAVERGSVEVSHPIVFKAFQLSSSEHEWTRKKSDVITSVSLSAGQGVRASRRNGIGRVMPAAAGAWRSGQLVYVSAPIEEVALDASRYGEKRIEVDASAKGLKLSGTFNAHDINGLLSALEEALPVRVETRDNRVVILKKQAS